MVKFRIFDNTQLLKEHPELPHYRGGSLFPE